jgi:hypothetical protein
VDIELFRKLPDGRPPKNQNQPLGEKCPYFFLRYDFQNDTLDVICPDDQSIEIDRSPEQIKEGPDIEKLLK